MVSSSERQRVVVCGAGPVGLAAAAALAQHEVPVTVLERQAQIASDPRAATLHPPTLDILAQLGVIDAVRSQGLVAPRFQFRDRASDEVIAVFDLCHLADDTEYPYCVQLEQHKLARLLREQIQRDGLDVELRLGSELTALDQDDAAVTLTLADQQRLSTAWLIGCDGGRSTVRKQLGVAFDGFTYRERFLVLTTPFDFQTERHFDYRNYVSDPRQWCALFKVPGDSAAGHWRVVFPTSSDETLSDDECLADEYCSSQLEGAFGATDMSLWHRNLYAVSQRVAASFRVGRVLLAGDAAHVNNPLGGLGMNSGIHDAWELAQTLAEVYHGQAPASLLDRYDRRRRTVADEFVQQQTVRNKQTLEERDPDKRRQALQRLHAAADRPAASRDFLLNTSLIASCRRAASIA